MDRRDAIRAYKETPRPMGVFRIHDTVNDRSVLGTSVDLPAMLNRVRFQLELGSYPDRSVQRDWDAHGADAFVIEVLDTLEPPEEPGYDPADDLAELKAMWTERLSHEGSR